MHNMCPFQMQLMFFFGSLPIRTKGSNATFVVLTESTGTVTTFLNSMVMV